MLVNIDNVDKLSSSIFRIIYCNIKYCLTYFAIKALYLNTEACVKINNLTTSWFESKLGVKQGDSLSPTLFNIFINDLCSSIKQSDLGITIDDINCSILMYADDVVLMAESENALQNMLNIVCQWMSKWSIGLNVKKSKCLHFRPNHVDKTDFDFNINDVKIDLTNTYKYLGVYFDEQLEFKENVTILSQAAGRALGSIINKYKRNNHMGFSTFTKLFESCVQPVMNYSSGVWGYSKFTQTDKVQQLALRVFLGVHKFAPVAVLYGDSGWLKPRYKRWIEIVRLWNRLLKLPESRLTRKIFDLDYSASSTVNNWCSKVKNIFQKTGNLELFDSKSFYDLKHLADLLCVRQQEEWQLEILN